MQASRILKFRGLLLLWLFLRACMVAEHHFVEMAKRTDPSKKMPAVAIIPAAGSGFRMGADRAKQFLDLDGKPLLAVTLKPFQASPAVKAIVLVVPPTEVEFCQKEIVQRFRLDKVKKVIAGGKRRQDSVRIGLEAAGKGYDLAVIHDGVRPLVDEKLIERMLEAGRTYGAAIPGLPVGETVKGVNNGGQVVETYDRGRIWLVQTPQVFRYEDILRAHQEAVRQGWEGATDDSLLIERMGIPVRVLRGSERNMKVTTPYDLELARFLLDSAKA